MTILSIHLLPPYIYPSLDFEQHICSELAGLSRPNLPLASQTPSNTAQLLNFRHDLGQFFCPRPRGNILQTSNQGKSGKTQVRGFNTHKLISNGEHWQSNWNDALIFILGEEKSVREQQALYTGHFLCVFCRHIRHAVFFWAFCHNFFFFKSV